MTHLNSKWIVPGEASVLIGGQFGSEAKGLAAAWLAHNFLPEHPNVGSDLICTTNAGAQAGHTTKYTNGKQFVCYHLPTTYVVAYKIGAKARGYINAGAIISIESLITELNNHEEFLVNEHGYQSDFLRFRWNLCINPFAAVISEKDVVNERTAGPARIASTGKGVGSALANKILRSPDFTNYGTEYENQSHTSLPRSECMDLNAHLDTGSAVIVEVPQGTGLSINHSRMYPHTTSRDCWVGSGLGDAGIHPSYLGPVCMVVRTFPIRVGNTVNDDGSINSSGPFYMDSAELTWEYFGENINPERTTVTKRIRRIATWSRYQYRDALRLNRPNIVFLTFVNYLNDIYELIKLTQSMNEDEQLEGIVPERVYSWGPNVEDCGTFYQAASWLYNRGKIR